MEDAFELGGNMVIETHRAERRMVHDGCADHGGTLAMEEHLPGRDLVKDCPERKQMRARIKIFLPLREET